MQHTNISIQQFIAGIQPQLPPQAIEAIEACFISMSFAKGELIVASGQVAPVYVLLKQGLVRAYTLNTEGEEVTTGIYSAGQVACDLSSFFRRVPSHSGQVATTIKSSAHWRIFSLVVSLYQRLSMSTSPS